MLHTPGARLQTGPDASRGRQPLIGCCCARARRRRWWAPRFGSAGRAAAAPPTAAAASAATPGPAPALATSSPAHLNERKLLGQLPLPLRFLNSFWYVWSICLAGPLIHSSSLHFLHFLQQVHGVPTAPGKIHAFEICILLVLALFPEPNHGTLRWLSGSFL